MSSGGCVSSLQPFFFLRRPQRKKIRLSYRSPNPGFSSAPSWRRNGRVRRSVLFFISPVLLHLHCVGVIAQVSSDHRNYGKEVSSIAALSCRLRALCTQRNLLSFEQDGGCRKKSWSVTCLPLRFWGSFVHDHWSTPVGFYLGSGAPGRVHRPRNEPEQLHK